VIAVDANITEVDKLLEQAGQRAGDLSGAWPDVGKWWQARQRTVFATGNRGAWPMRAAGAKRLGKAPMIGTGALLRSVSSPRPLYSSPSTARFGHKGYGVAFYARFHQFGQSQPVRQVVPGLTGTEADEVVEILLEHIMGEK